MRPGCRGALQLAAHLLPLEHMLFCSCSAGLQLSLTALHKTDWCWVAGELWSCLLPEW